MTGKLARAIPVHTLYTISKFARAESHKTYYMIIEPNGVNDKRASLKYCFPKGMPIIEMQYKHPKAAAVNDNGKPVTHIQTKFSKKLHVVLFGAITYLPNGKKHTEAI